MVIAAWIIALFFAANIGASGTAASMGSAYGAGAIKRKWLALVLVAVAAFMGAIIGGGSVVKTISGGIVPSHLITTEVTVIILASACATLFCANLIGVPLSTSEVTVGAVVGAGLALGHVYAGKVLFIVIVWLVMPFIAMAIGLLLGRVVRLIEPKCVGVKSVTVALTILLVLAGCYEAFSAGMNNVANAIGPLVAAGMISAHSGLYLGAAFVAIGAIALGGRVLDTNAKKITKLTLLQGSVVSITSGTLVLISSFFGLPVPLTQATTMAIFGVGQAKVGKEVWRQDVVKRIVRTWIASPVSSMALTFLMIQLVMEGKVVPVVVILVIAFGLISWRFVATRRRRYSIYDR
ncbi:inorganic phosphate transporter [Alicyclobacillus fodiniaquatilis]|jgi:sulfate permease|uniref:Anion permease n=1 Tax=Alicyclobacillus fodiniaquatilis TaxID=1661150 RepID=A0ABW4JQH5_9BACL